MSDEKKKSFGSIPIEEGRLDKGGTGCTFYVKILKGKCHAKLEGSNLYD